MTMNNLNTLEITLINLDQSDQRRAKMVDSLAELGLTFSRFSAVDGRAEFARLSGTCARHKFERNVGRSVLPGELGVYHSHLTVWREFLKTGKELLLVLEDDVVFHSDFVPVLTLAIEHGTDWDFLKLNKIRAKQPIRQKKLGAYNLNAYLGPATGLGAYLIKRETIERLLPNMLPIRRPIDHELDRIFTHDFRHFGIEPFPSHVNDEGTSTITGKDFSNVKKKPAWQRLPSLVLRLVTTVRKLIYLLRKRRIFQ